MIVVSNTSPLTNLAAIRQFHLLRNLYSEIHIPHGVWEELNAMGKPWPGSKEVAEAQWVHQHMVKNSLWVRSLRKDLDRGESESIVLASELNSDMILLEAKSKKLVKTIRPHLDALRQVAGFRISTSVYAHALDLADE